MERWLQIPGFEKYEISDYGRARRKDGGRGTRAGRHLKLTEDGYGRLVFNAHMGDWHRQLKVHQAVMLAFVGPCPPGHEVAHVDGDTEHNWIGNLIYATPLENAAHKKKHGTQPMGVTVYNARLNEESVKWIRSNIGKITLTEMAQQLGVALMTVHHVKARRTWKHLD